MDSGILHILDTNIPNFMKGNITNYLTKKESSLARALWAAGKVGYDLEEIDFIFLENEEPYAARNSGSNSYRLGLHIKDFDPGKATQFKLLMSGENSSSL